MLVRHTPFAVALAALLVGATAVPAQTTTTGRRGGVRRGIEGVVVQVHHDRQNRHAGWIKVRHTRSNHHRYGRRGRTSVAASVGRNHSRGGSVMTYAVNRSTLFERLGQNGRGGRTSFAAVRRGERVRVVGGSGRHRAAREVDILSYGVGRSRHHHGHRGGSAYGRRYSSRRHPLVNSRVLNRTVNRRRTVVNRPVVVRTVTRKPVRHSLTQGRVASRQLHKPVTSVKKQAAHKTTKPVAKTTPTRNTKPQTKNTKTTTPKTTRTTASKPKPPAKHNPAHHSNPKPKQGHSSGHHSSTHKKR